VKDLSVLGDHICFDAVRREPILYIRAGISDLPTDFVERDTNAL
jgi:hypothetical protein